MRNMGIEWNAGKHEIEPRRAMSLLLQQVATETGITRDQMLGNQRNGPVVRARWRFIAECHDLGYSSGEIGRFLGQDHTTVLHAIKNRDVGPRRGRVKDGEA